MAEEYRKSLALGGYHIFTPLSVIEKCMKDKIPRFCKVKKDDAIMAATNLFGDIINIHPFESVELVLMQMNWSLLLVLLSSFLRRSRRH